MIANNRIASFCEQPVKPLALFTADELRDMETSCKTQVDAIEANAKAVCIEQWKGAVLIGVLIGAGGGQLLEVAIEFFAF